MRTVPGRHSVFEALRVRPESVSKVFIDENADKKKWFSDLKKITDKNKIKLIKRKDSFFSQLTQNSQGVACEVHDEPEWPDETKENLFILMLDGVEDPHNFGAIIRSAWLLGVDGIVIPKKESTGLTPTALKVASGGAEHVPVLTVNNLKNKISELKNDYGFWSYGLWLGEGTEDINTVTKSEKTILIAGAEEKGIRPGVLKDCDFKIKIPQKNSEASFNVSVATALGISALKL